MSNHTPTDMDVREIVSIEPSDRGSFWDLIVWTIDGERVLICTDVRTVVEQRLEAIHTALATYPGFGHG